MQNDVMIDPRRATSRPTMERPYVAFLLAVAAGIMSGFTFFIVQLFSTVQSGNVVQAGYQLAAHNGIKWQHAVFALLAFGLGSAATAVLQNVMTRQRRDYSNLVLLTETSVLLALGHSFVPDHLGVLSYAYVVSFLAGMQGNAFHRVDGLMYGNVAVTLVVQLAFNHLVQACFANPSKHLFESVIYFAILLGFAGGGFVGAWGTGEFDQRVLWFAAAILATLAFWNLMQLRQGGPVDIPFD